MTNEKMVTAQLEKGILNFISRYHPLAAQTRLCMGINPWTVTDTGDNITLEGDATLWYIRIDVTPPDEKKKVVKTITPYTVFGNITTYLEGIIDDYIDFTSQPGAGVISYAETVEMIIRIRTRMNELSEFYWRYFAERRDLISNQQWVIPTNLPGFARSGTIEINGNIFSYEFFMPNFSSIPPGVRGEIVEYQWMFERLILRDLFYDNRMKELLFILFNKMYLFTDEYRKLSNHEYVRRKIINALTGQYTIAQRRLMIQDIIYPLAFGLYCQSESTFRAEPLIQTAKWNTRPAKLVLQRTGEQHSKTILDWNMNVSYYNNQEFGLSYLLFPGYHVYNQLTYLLEYVVNSTSPRNQINLLQSTDSEALEFKDPDTIITLSDGTLNVPASRQDSWKYAYLMSFESVSHRIRIRTIERRGLDLSIFSPSEILSFGNAGILSNRYLPPAISLLIGINAGPILLPFHHLLKSPTEKSEKREVKGNNYFNELYFLNDHKDPTKLKVRGTTMGQIAKANGPRYARDEPLIHIEAGEFADVSNDEEQEST